MFRSVWRIQWTGLLADSVMFAILVLLGALGIRYISPWIIMLAGFALSVAIYRIRYKRF
jgi:hypothetical protein